MIEEVTLSVVLLPTCELVALADWLNPMTVGVAVGAVIVGVVILQLVAWALLLYAAAIVQLLLVAFIVLLLALNVTL